MDFILKSWNNFEILEIVSWFGPTEIETSDALKERFPFSYLSDYENLLLILILNSYTRHMSPDKDISQ